MVFLCSRCMTREKWLRFFRTIKYQKLMNSGEDRAAYSIKSYSLYSMDGESSDALKSFPTGKKMTHCLFFSFSSNMPGKQTKTVRVFYNLWNFAYFSDIIVWTPHFSRHQSSVTQFFFKFYFFHLSATPTSHPLPGYDNCRLKWVCPEIMLLWQPDRVGLHLYLVFYHLKIYFRGQNL